MKDAEKSWGIFIKQGIKFSVISANATGVYRCVNSV